MSQHHKSTRHDRAARKAYRAECADQDLPCWLCHGAIDYNASWDDWGNNDRFQRDHFYPASTHPELYDDPTNWRPSHAGCNERRGNSDAIGGLGIPSRQWAPAH